MNDDAYRFTDNGMVRNVWHLEHETRGWRGWIARASDFELKWTLHHRERGVTEDAFSATDAARRLLELDGYDGKISPRLLRSLPQWDTSAGTFSSPWQKES